MARKKQQAAETQADAPEAAQTTVAAPQAQPPAAEIPASQPEPEKPQRQFGARRSWSERYTGPLQYEMFTVGKTIMFRFKLPKGQDKPAEEALEIMRSYKQNEEGIATRLHFQDSRLHGKVWTIPNDQEGRELAGKIEMDLNKVARKMEAELPLPA